jgi:hypothetical protein
MSRDDGMDEHGIEWLHGCPLAGFAGLGIVGPIITTLPNFLMP